MLIYDALKNDHDRVKSLLEQLVGLDDTDEEERDDLVEQIRDELIPHARAEEAVFYNYLRDIDMAKHLVEHSYGEHLEVEALLRTLQAKDAMNGDWLQTARKLQKELAHHIAEEETKVFAGARQLLIDEEARAMADAFERIKPEVREGSLMQNTLDMIANMLPESIGSHIRSFSNPKT